MSVAAAVVFVCGGEGQVLQNITKLGRKKAYK
jgi:hypothetical protein